MRSSSPGRWEDVGARFVELDAAGMSAREISAKLNISERCVSRWRRRLGTAQESPPIRTPADHDFAKQLLDDGCPRAEIARTLGADVKTISRWFPDAQWWTRAEVMSFARGTKATRAVRGSLHRTGKEYPHAS